VGKSCWEINSIKFCRQKGNEERVGSYTEEIMEKRQGKGKKKREEVWIEKELSKETKKKCEGVCLERSTWEYMK
jgi:hypothetical protein